MKNLESYNKILEIYNQVSVIGLYKETRLFKYLISLFIYYFISIGIILYLSHDNTIEKPLQNISFVINGIIFILGIVSILWIMENRMRKRYSKQYKNFIKENSKYFRGFRALLFIEKIKKEKLDFNTDEIIKLIDLDIGVKNNNLLQNPFYTAMIGVGGIIIGTILNKIDELSNLIVIFIVYIFIFYLGMALVDIFRSKEYKKYDLKLFLAWNKSFAQNDRLS